MSEFENENQENNIEGSASVDPKLETTHESTVQQEQPDPQPSLGQRAVKEIVSWILCIAIALCAAFVLRTWVFTVVKVDGHSMNPTLHDQERLFTRIIGYRPQHGDVIIFHPKSNPSIAYVKRVMALEGDRIWVDEQTGDVHRKKAGSDKWEILDEPYIAEKPLAAGIAARYTDDSGEEGLLIEKDHIFVMGDNRNRSNDSRNDIGENAVGQVPLSSVIGKAVFRWWPLSEFGTIH